MLRAETAVIGMWRWSNCLRIELSETHLRLSATPPFSMLRSDAACIPLEDIVLSRIAAGPWTLVEKANVHVRKVPDAKIEISLGLARKVAVASRGHLGVHGPVEDPSIRVP